MKFADDKLSVMLKSAPAADAQRVRDVNRLLSLQA